MPEGPVRVASVCLGQWAKTLADAIRRSDRLRIVNCFSRAEKYREAFAQQYRCRAAKSLKNSRHASEKTKDLRLEDRRRLLPWR